MIVKSSWSRTRKTRKNEPVRTNGEEDGELASMGGSFIRGESRTEEEGGAVGEGEHGTEEKVL